jgi:hypothetical protein
MPWQELTSGLGLILGAAREAEGAKSGRFCSRGCLTQPWFRTGGVRSPSTAVGDRLAGDRRDTREVTTRHRRFAQPDGSRYTLALRRGAILGRLLEQSHGNVPEDLRDRAFGVCHYDRLAGIASGPDIGI